MNKTLVVIALATAFGLAAAGNMNAAGPQWAQPDPFTDKRSMMGLELCEHPGNLEYDFLEAARVARVELTKCFLEKHPRLIDVKDADGINAIMWVAVKQDGEDATVTADRDALFDYLSSKKPSLVTESRDKHGSSLLAYMAMNRYLSRMEKALAMGADMNAKDNYGVTPYGEAASFGNAAVVAMLEKFAKEKGIAIDRSGIPALPPKTEPDSMPDGTPAPPLETESPIFGL